MSMCMSASYRAHDLLKGVLLVSDAVRYIYIYILTNILTVD